MRTELDHIIPKDYATWHNEQSRRNSDRADRVVFWLAVACAIVGLLCLNNVAAEPCSTDTECMEQHGGDGGPGSEGVRG